MNILYVGKTNKGYVKGDILQGVSFVDKNNARKFTFDEACAYKDSIAQDMFDFYDCEYFEWEKFLR